MDGEIKGRYPVLLSILSSSFYAKDYEGKGTTQEVFFGNLIPLPKEIVEGMCEYSPPMPISNDSPNKQHKVLYAVGRIG